MEISSARPQVPDLVAPRAALEDEGNTAILVSNEMAVLRQGSGSGGREDALVGFSRQGSAATTYARFDFAAASKWKPGHRQPGRDGKQLRPLQIESSDNSFPREPVSWLHPEMAIFDSRSMPTAVDWTKARSGRPP